jgi:hypothetical protein
LTVLEFSWFEFFEVNGILILGTDFSFFQYIKNVVRKLGQLQTNWRAPFARNGSIGKGIPDCPTSK